ncbi:hypothetical protein [Tautonia marina]|uniref:hypothetical protein n=1 Tax=Tautonia marina TaxID=2653855 RepID=UPI001260E2D5|nr:hypothetical protein [Tautonia marina]
MRRIITHHQFNPRRGGLPGRRHCLAAGIATGALVVFLSVPSMAWAQVKDRVSGPGDEALSQAEGRNIHNLLFNHSLLIRHVVHDYEDEHGSGVMALTWVSDPEAYPWLVEVLQEHVAQMEERLERGARIYQRDLVFRMIFDLADEITFEYELIPGGVLAFETSHNPLAAELIRLHAEKVNLFIAQGQSALLPVSARGGRRPDPQ